MITVNIEVRVANHFDGALDCERIDKSDAAMTWAEMAVDVLAQSYPVVRESPYCIVESKQWKKLPKRLYEVMENETSSPALFRKIRKEVVSPSGAVCPIYLIFGCKSGVPTAEISFFTTTEDAKAFVDNKKKIV